MTVRTPFLWRRMGSTSPLLASVAVSALLATAAIAALTSLAAGALPHAVGGDLARAPGTAIAISGQFGAAQASRDQRAVPAALRRALGPIGGRPANALWSDSLGLAGPSQATIQAAALSEIRRRAKLTAGSWPQATPSGQQVPLQPPQTVAPASVAATLHLHVGQLLILRDRSTGSPVRLRLTGLYAILRPAAPYWRLDLIGTGGVSVLPGFTTYGPFLVSPASFGPGGLPVGGASWLDSPALSDVTAAQLTPLAGRLRLALGQLTSSAGLGGLQVSSSLPTALIAVATRLAVARSLLAVSELELLLLALAALVLAARTLTSQREPELAMLTARGAGRWRLGWLALIEGLAVAAVAAAIGGLAGGRLARWLATTGPLRQDGQTPIGMPAATWWSAGLVALLCAAILAWPSLRPLTPGAASSRRGRSAVASAAARAGGDVALVALAVLACWQLRQYSVLSALGGTAGGGATVNPVLAVAPAFALAAATIVPLRLVPVLASGADRLAARSSRLSVALTSWQLSRRAVRQSAPLLLVVLAVGAGTLALAQHQSWRQSASDQSAFTAGADVRATLRTPTAPSGAAAIATAPGVAAAMPVSTGLATTGSGQVLALDPERALATVLLRPDQSALPPAELWRTIVPARAGDAVALPGHPARLKITASLTLASAAPARPANPARPVNPARPALVTVSVQDATGTVYLIRAGLLAPDGRRHDLIATLSPPGQAIYPLRLLAVSLDRATLPGAALSIRALAVSATAAGAFDPPLTSGLAGWATRRSAGHLTFTARAPFTVIPGIATTAFLRAAHTAVGQVVQISAAQASIAVRIVAVVASFPTITSQAGGLIVDQAAVADLIAAQAAPPLPVTHWWLATTGADQSTGLLAALPAGAGLTVRAHVLAVLESDPLAAIPQLALLLIAIAAGVLAVVGFLVSVIASVSERRPQTALLAALGVSPAAQARLLCLEALAISGPAAVTGLLAGDILARLLVPAVTVTAAATAPVPSVVVVVPLATSALLALAVMALPVLAAAASAIGRPDPAAQLRAAATL